MAGSNDPQGSGSQVAGPAPLDGLRAGMGRRRFLQAAGAAAGASALAAGSVQPAAAAQARPAVARQGGALQGPAVRFGANYIPSKQWWYQWYDWDPGSIARDLHAVAQLGFDHIRIQCLWPAFQPNPGLVSTTALDRLAQLLDLAHGAGLDAEITLLDGYLSGFLFRPAWQQPGMGFFTDPTVLTAQKQLIQAVAKRVGNHPALLGLDLGNEPDWIPSIDTISGVNGYQVATDNGANPDQGQAWAAALLDLADQLLPGKVNVVGANANAWAGDIQVFTPATLANVGTVTSIHDYYYPGPPSEQVYAAEYMVELAKAYADAPSRQVWVEEFGYSVTGQSPDQQISTANHAEAILRNMMTCGNLFGWAIWASHDIDPSLTGFAASEYHFGMLGLDNKPTVVGQRLARLIKEFRSSPPPAARSTALVIPQGTTVTYDNLGKYFFQLILQGGIRPAIVQQSRSADQAYLTKRGITDLVQPGDVDSYLAGLPPAPLADACNNVGITTAGNCENGNFDGGGKSYPASQLAQAGLSPGTTVQAGGMRFTWTAKPNDFDNVTGPGRPLALTGPAGATMLGLLGAASYGPYTGNATVTYTDHSTDSVSLALSDWTLNGGTAKPAAGNNVVATTHSVHTYSGTPDNTAAYIFSASLPVNPAKTVAQLALPGPQPSQVHSLTVSTVLGQSNTDNNLSQIACGDGMTNPVTTGGQSGRETAPPQNGNMYFQFAAGLAENGNFEATFTITYFDNNAGSWQLQYDSTDPNGGPVAGAYTTAGTVQQQGTGTWKTAKMTVSNARFAGRQNCGADFRIAGPVPVIVHSVQVDVTGTGLFPDAVPHIFATAFGS